MLVAEVVCMCVKGGASTLALMTSGVVSESVLCVSLDARVPACGVRPCVPEFTVHSILRMICVT